MAWTAAGGGNHEGADWIIGSDMVVGGVHTGVRNFKVSQGINASIQGPSATPVGLEVQAISILVDGAIIGTGKGYNGGAGGAGVYSSGCYGSCPSSCSGSARAGGNGVAGAGFYPGGGNSGTGGYGAAASNGDSSVDQSVLHGSGGGGGRAGSSCTPNCNAWCPNSCGCGPSSNSNRCRGGRGGQGGAGGAAIKLVASSFIQIIGAIESKGGNTIGGGGGENDSCGNGSKGSNSGPGAGGGVLLTCSGTFGIKITGTIDTRGGNSSTVNYGSCKLFGVTGRINTNGAALNTGHSGSGGYGHPLKRDTLSARAIIF